MIYELASRIILPKSHGVPSDSDNASVWESLREIQLLESSKIVTACRKLNFESFHQRDCRDGFRVTVGSIRNTDVLPVLQTAREDCCRSRASRRALEIFYVFSMSLM